MANPLSLLLPALIPSWNFFDVIAPSPRVEYALPRSMGDIPAEWREFRPRPERLSLVEMAKRLVWNPRWNQTLFVASCAERLVTTPTDHSEDEIFARIAADLLAGPDAPSPDALLVFRLVFVSRQGEALEREVLYQPAPRRIGDIVR